VDVPRHRLSLEEFNALPEDNSARYELQEGVLVVTPRRAPEHLRAAFRIARQLDDQLPVDLEALIEAEVCLEPEFPPTVRIPDVVVTQTVKSGGTVRVEDVVVAIGVMSPGSRRTDTVTKPFEYAEAGIPHYWLVDLDPPVSLTAYRLAGELGYQEYPAVIGVFTTREPAEIRLELADLPNPR
jgi:Uma2 family endonuclease